ncbi:MAG: hypothetical protein U0441_23380 [Polyangiaceae bacterium]
MRERTIAELFNIPNRFLRSANLERDFQDPQALDGYILTDPTQQALERILAGLQPDSGQRAWRVTGDYGTGKSSFGLLLAHVLTQRKLPSALARATNHAALGHGRKRVKLLPLLVMGAREGLTTALARTIIASLEGLHEEKRMPVALRRIREKFDVQDVSEAAILRALGDLRTYVVDSERATGLLLIVDELGKFLEYGSLQANADVYVLQRLAEMAARSGEHPVVIVGLLHQSFHAYAERLPQAARQEWEKIAGRFDEIVFDQPLEHTSLLVAGALRVRADAVRDMPDRARRSMESAARFGWYGSGADARALVARAPEMYPLHPFVLPPLVRFLRRFGQHERSLFGFLLSTEPFGLQDFAAGPVESDRWYRLHDLYDFVRSNYGHLLGGQSHRSHWVRISSMIDGLKAEDDLALQVLKTVAMLNLLDAEDLLATSEVVVHALDEHTRTSVTTTIAKLKDRNLLYDRGTAGGYCLWPHTSVSLERAYQEAERAINTIERASAHIGPHVDSRPLVARRHHIETGTLRHFEVRFRPFAELAEALLDEPETADGLVLVPLCDTKAEHRLALELATSAPARKRGDMLIAVPEPLENVALDVRRVECWNWVVKNTPALNSDSYAAAEAGQQLQAARRKLQRTLEDLVGLRGASPATTLQWFHLGNRITIRSGRELIDQLSQICNKLFPYAPTITHELLNRRSLSSAGAKARQGVIERLLDSAHLPMLGLDEDRAPPEKSIYLSILQRGGIHQQDGGAYTIAEPSAERDLCRLLPVFRRIHEMLAAAPDVRIGVTAIESELRRAPYGVRDGVLPLLLAIYIKAHEHELAFYERGSYVTKVGGAEILRLIKAPEIFEIQLCQVVGVRADVFDRLLTLLDVATPPDRKPALLDVVAPLCMFAADLPEYARKTSRLSDQARAVRSALVAAREPVTLLFQDLPKACGVQPFAPGDQLDDANVQAFVRTLRDALDELRGAYGALLVRIEKALHTAVRSESSARDTLAKRVHGIQLNIREARLRAFCVRLADQALPLERWLEALASVVISKPPNRWTDADERLFVDEVTSLGETFQRVEALGFARGEAAHGTAAVRVLLTMADGTEVTRVVDLSQGDDARVAEIERRVSEILTDGLGLVATSRAVWKALVRGAS